MSEWIVYPECADLVVVIDDLVKIPDPTWPGVGFFIAFVIGGIIGGLLAKCCYKDYVKKRMQDEEEKTLIAQGIPVRFRGKERSQFLQMNENAKLESKIDQSEKDDLRSATPSAIDLEDLDPTSGFADALSKPSDHATDAELFNQDLKELSTYEDSLRDSRIDALLLLLNSMLGSNIAPEVMNKITNKIREMYTELVTDYFNKAKTAQLEVNQKHPQNSVESQTEFDKINAILLQRLNSELLGVEDSVPTLLRENTQISEQDVEAIMKKLKHQLATREKRVCDETRRQLQSLEERLARRKEMAEQYKLLKQTMPDTIKAKVEHQKDAVGILVKNDKLTQEQCDEIMGEYEKDLLRIQAAYEEERENQEDLLAEKLRKKRAQKLKKLSSQQIKTKEAYMQKLNNSADSSVIKEYDTAMAELSDATSQTTQEIDAEEFSRLSQLVSSVQQDFSSQFGDADTKMYDYLKSFDVNEADVRRIIQLHKQEMKEYDRNRQNEQKKAIAKLQQKLAERQQRSQQIEHEEERTYNVIKDRQDETIQQVLGTHADLTEDAVKMIMEEHHRNMITLKNQLQISKTRQHRKLEQRLAERKAAIAARKAEKRDKESQNEKEALERLEQEHQQQLIQLRERLAEETKEALSAQEQQLCALIGQLEVGQARRRNILLKQEKLISELEKQLANKIDDTPRGVTTTTELLQKHYGQVTNLTNALQTNRERQEHMLQERLDQIKLQRRSELDQQMRIEAQKEEARMRAKGVGVASSIMTDIMLQQRHEKALEALEQEMKIELQRARDEMNDQFNQELLTALSEEGKNFMANLAASNGLSNADITEAMNNAAQAIHANDKTVKRLAKEMKTRIKTAKGNRQRVADDY